ncbi:unnamed protein product [Caenorhabditis bovis]|uniref:CCHC-type domain-containing protein n=1 Tax=Caenorhabditis bovis TaxID=2654633 RepID=A0A8S1EEB7_9PELO|nr:unnamed protein product [Caenorhabditis bovis]
MALAKSLSLSDLSEIRISCAKPFSRMQDSDTVKGSQLKTLQSACVTDFEVTHGVMRSLAERAENRIKGFAEIPRINTVTASMRPSSQVPIFGGSPNDTFSAFLRSFNDHANTAKPPLGDLEKRNIFLTYLTDAARDRAEEFLEQESEASFATLVNHLKVKYEDPVRAELSRQQLRTTNQLPGESVDEFAAKVRKLANSSYLGYSREYIKAKTLEAFLDGLKYDIKFHVKASNLRTFEDALNSAVRYEILLQEAARANTIHPQTLPVALLQGVDNQNRERTARTLPPQHRFRNTPRQVKCYFCGRLGHMMANCFKKNRQFGRIDPIDNHQIRNRNQPIFGNPGRRTNNYEGNSSDVRNFQPDTAADDTVRELRAQVEALTIRNNQLTNSMTPRVNTVRVSKLPLFIALLACLASPTTAFNALLCLPNSPESLINFPSSFDCNSVKPSPFTQTKKVSLSVYRPNSIAYDSTATLCKIIQTTSTFSVNLFGSRYIETNSKQATVSAEECKLMMNHQRCSFADKLTKIVSRNAFSTSGSTKASEISEVISAYEQWLDLGHRLFQAWTAIVCTFVTLYAIFLVVAIFIKQQAEALPFSVSHRFGKKTANPPSEVIFDYSDLLPATTTIATFHSPQAFFTAQIPIKANNINLLALVDTGASFTIAGSEICALIGIHTLNKPLTNNAIGLGGNEVKIAGTAPIRYKIGSFEIQHITHFTINKCTPPGPFSYDIILELGLLIAPTVISTNHIALLVTNPSNQMVTLYPEMTIATAAMVFSEGTPGKVLTCHYSSGEIHSLRLT